MGRAGSQLIDLPRFGALMTQTTNDRFLEQTYQNTIMSDFSPFKQAMKYRRTMRAKSSVNQQEKYG